MSGRFLNNPGFVTVLLLFCISFSVEAQDEKSRINAIKKNPAYIYGEATLSSSDEAAAASREILLLNLKQFVKENPESLELLPVSLPALADSAEIIQTARGTMARAFSFVHKSSFAVYAEPSVEAETPLPAPEKRTVAEIFEERIAPVTDLFILYSILDSDEWSSCSKYGKVKADTPPADLAVSYLVVFKPDDYSISAILTPKHEGGRLNMVSGQSDSTRNYSGCQAVWVKLNM